MQDVHHQPIKAEVAIDGADSVDPSLNLVRPGVAETFDVRDVEGLGM